MSETIWRLPSPSQEFVEGPSVKLLGDRLVLKYDFETPDGNYLWEECSFLGVAGFCFTESQYCDPDQIAAYDALQVVNDNWRGNLTTDVPAGCKHFRIYFDEVGCYEVLAVTFVPPPGT